MRSTFKVLFYLKRNAPKKNGLVPVMCRITVNGKIAQFSCKLDVEEKTWNVELGRVSGRSIVAQEANRMLDKIRVGINQAYQKIADRDNYVTAEKVRNAYLGLGMNYETLLAVFRQHNEDYEKQVGKLKSLRSYWKYCTVYNHLAEFIEKRYKVSDIALRELAPAFITDFELFLKTEKNHCNNTVWSYMMPFRKIIYMAVNNGLLQRDPFFAYSITKEETKRGFLTKEEIKLLINGTFKKKSYEVIRDLFIFCTFTGLSWTDMANLTKANLQTSFDGHLWIITNRQKTGTESNIRLLDVAKHIIEKYDGMAEGDKLLPVPCYANCKNSIKVIARKCGIEKNVTWHMSRHTYATTVCLSNDVPIETLSKMLGHRITITVKIMSNSESQNRKGKGGRKPKFDYTSEEFLSLVESYAKKGFTDKEIAYAIGILPQTFCEKKSEYTEISEVLARGRATINATVRAKFLAIALGGIKTKSTVVRKLRDSEGNLTGEDELQVSESELAPNLQAMSVWLYHHDEDWRKVERKQDEDADIPTDIEHGINIDSWIKDKLK